VNSCILVVVFILYVSFAFIFLKNTSPYFEAIMKSHESLGGLKARSVINLYDYKARLLRDINKLSQECTI